MDRLTERQKIALTRATVLIEGTPAGDGLSEFELETVLAVNRRWQAFGDACVTTPDEFAVVDQAVAAMEAWLRRAFASLSAPVEAAQPAMRAA